MTFSSLLRRLAAFGKFQPSESTRQTCHSTGPADGTSTSSRADLSEGFRESIRQVIQHAYIGGISVNGDYYRYNAQLVAAAASLGLLTTETHLEGFTRIYRPTHAGMGWVQC